MMTVSDNSQRPDLAIFIPTFGEGGVDRMMVNIAGGLANRGVAVDFIINKEGAPYLGELLPNVNQVYFRAESDRELAHELLQYLQAHRPKAIMTGKGRDDRIALAARDKLTFSDTRFILRVGTTIASRARLKLPMRWQRGYYGRKFRATCDRYDVLLANAEAVAREVSEVSGLPRERITVVPNPTVTEKLYALASEPPGHPWLAQETPVILGIGGLRRQKDFSTLIRAFARLRSQRQCRLIILGSGRQHRRLQRLAQRMGIADDVDLPGFTPNPYAYLSRASLFVLSSLWEGLPNVLIEALAVGTPVVSTDCPGGAREILENGRYGPLVSPGDFQAMSDAMAVVLDAPPEQGTLRAAAARYTAGAAAEAYLQALGLAPPSCAEGCGHNH